jgi:hypothetical protein
MSTPKQIAANRKNAQKSTGPKTPQGRAAVRHNGLKHGLTSSILVLEGESAADFEDLLDSLEAEHQPSTPTELILVRQIAMAAWRLQRLYHMEGGLYSIRRVDLQQRFDDYTELNTSDELAVVAHYDSSNTLMNFSRYEARLDRTLHKALTALHRYRVQRHAEMQNQSQSQNQTPQPPQPRVPAPSAEITPILPLAPNPHVPEAVSPAPS